MSRFWGAAESGTCKPNSHRTRSGHERRELDRFEIISSARRVANAVFFEASSLGENKKKIVLRGETKNKRSSSPSGCRWQLLLMLAGWLAGCLLLLLSAVGCRWRLLVLCHASWVLCVLQMDW